MQRRMGGVVMKDDEEVRDVAQGSFDHPTSFDTITIQPRGWRSIDIPLCTASYTPHQLQHSWRVLVSALHLRFASTSVFGLWTNYLPCGGLLHWL
jgi:hypothetical protein